MKIAYLFLLLVGLAAAKPTRDPSLAILDHTLLFRVLNVLNGNYENFNENFKNITKAQFEDLLKQRDAFLRKYDEVVIPVEFVKVIRSVTVDDYDVIKRFMEVGKTGTFSFSDLHEFAPLAVRFETVREEYNEQLAKVTSPTTQELAAKAIMLYEYLKTTRNLTSEEVMKITVKEYLRWPQGAKEELDKIFPKLSVKAEEWFGTLANDNSIPSLDPSLCRNVEHYLCEEFRMVVARAQVAKM